MKFEIPGLIRVGAAHRLFSGTVLDLTSQYTGFEGGAVSISTVEESYEGTRDNCLGRASTDLKLRFLLFFLKSWLVYMYLRVYTRIYIYIYIARA